MNPEENLSADEPKDLSDDETTNSHAHEAEVSPVSETDIKHTENLSVAQSETLSVEEADRHAIVKKSFGRAEKIIFSVLFVVFFIVAHAISLSHFPGYEEAMIPFVRRYAGFFGLEQNWSMFSRLRKANGHTIAVITFADGTEKMYEYPRFDLMDQFTHFQFEKRRSLFSEFLPGRWGKKYRPASVRHLIWCNENEKNQPDIVTLVYNYIEVPKPDPDHWVRFSDLPFHSTKEPYFVYRVSKSDLEDYVESNMNRPHSK